MSRLHHDPNWPRASAWLSGESFAETSGSLAVLGAPLNSSITPGNCNLAPDAIRTALQRFSTYDLAHDRDLRRLKVADSGDLPISDAEPEEAFDTIVEGLAPLVADQATVLIGGDNGITRGGVHSLPFELNRCGLLTLDAHFDLRDLDDGLTNGNPVRALLADGMPGQNIAQIGLQSFANSNAYAEVARDAGIVFTTADDVHERGIDAVLSEALDKLSDLDAIYFDLDLDVLDRAYAPATPGSRPGGLHPWQVRRAAAHCGSHAKVLAMDLVEVDPTKDIASVTVLAAAACLLSFASGVLGRCR